MKFTLSPIDTKKDWRKNIVDKLVKNFFGFLSQML